MQDLKQKLLVRSENYIKALVTNNKEDLFPMESNFWFKIQETLNTLKHNNYKIELEEHKEEF